MFSRGYVIAERYEIIEEVGSGGMAIIYKAKDLRLDRIVAVKMLRKDSAIDEDIKKQYGFGAEAQNIASLNHPNIVAVYDMDDQVYNEYIVMEYVDGDTLKEIIEVSAPFDNLQVIGTTRHIAQALSHAHEHKIVHRDIKPQNILVANDGTIKVADFGIARSMRSSTIEFNRSTMCSAHYASPEQVRTGAADTRSDLYSLGIIMFEMATGRLPFDGDDTLSIAYKHQNEPLPDIYELAPDIYPALASIIEKLTQKDPAYRYQSADSLIADLDLALEDPEHMPRPEIDMDGITKKVIVSNGKTRGSKIYIGTDADDDARYDDYDDDYYDNKGYKYDAYDRKQAKKEKIILACAVISGIAIVAVAVLLILRNVDFFSNDERPLPVIPDLVGMHIDEAWLDMELLGLSERFWVRGEEYSEEFAEGYITRVDRPGAIGNTWNPSWAEDDGSYLMLGVFVSLGSRTVTVPDVRDYTLAGARAAAAELNLTIVEEALAYSVEVPMNHIISQEPEPGTLVMPGTSISVVISQGPSIVSMVVPNVVGMSEAQANTELTERGFLTRPPRRVHHETIETGVVIQQDPPAGQTVYSNLILLDISLGPAAAAPPLPIVPGVVGLSEEAAAEALAAHDFGVSAIVRVYHETVYEGYVISQTPTAGTPYGGGQVSLEVSMGPEPYEEDPYEDYPYDDPDEPEPTPPPFELPPFVPPPIIPTPPPTPTPTPAPYVPEPPYEPGDPYEPSDPHEPGEPDEPEPPEQPPEEPPEEPPLATATLNIMLEIEPTAPTVTVNVYRFTLAGQELMESFNIYLTVFPFQFGVTGIEGSGTAVFVITQDGLPAGIQEVSF